MASFHMKMMLISFSLIFLSIFPHSLGETDKEKYLNELCRNNKRPEQCKEIIKSQYARFDTDDEGKAYTANELARSKAIEIRDFLNQLQQDSDNNEFKEKYMSCSNNYNDVIRDIDLAKSYLDSHYWVDLVKISAQVHSAMEDFKSCRNAFEIGSFDPAHVRVRNKEFVVYADLVEVAGERVVANYWNTMQ